MFMVFTGKNWQGSPTGVPTWVGHGTPAAHHSAVSVDARLQSVPPRKRITAIAIPKSNYYNLENSNKCHRLQLMPM